MHGKPPLRRQGNRFLDVVTHQGHNPSGRARTVHLSGAPGTGLDLSSLLSPLAAPPALSRW